MDNKEDFIKQMEKVSKDLQYIEKGVKRNEKMLKRQLKPIPSFSQRILQWILNVFGTVYVVIEQFVEYPDDDVILGMPIDEDLQKMSRKQLCRYMDAVLPQRGFFDIQSTSKIRLGCQLLRNYKSLIKDNDSLKTSFEELLEKGKSRK